MQAQFVPSDNGIVQWTMAPDNGIGQRASVWGLVCAVICASPGTFSFQCICDTLRRRLIFRRARPASQSCLTAIRGSLRKTFGRHVCGQEVITADMNFQPLLEKEMHCSCGRVHSTDLKAIDIGRGALQRLPLPSSPPKSLPLNPLSCRIRSSFQTKPLSAPSCCICRRMRIWSSLLAQGR